MLKRLIRLWPFHNLEMGYLEKYQWLWVVRQCEIVGLDGHVDYMDYRAGKRVKTRDVLRGRVVGPIREAPRAESVRVD